MIIYDRFQVSNNYGGENSLSEYDYDLAIFVKNFVGFTFNYFNILDNVKIRENSPYELIDVIRLLVYANVNGITSTLQISNNSENHYLYHLVSNYLIISDRSLRDYRKEYKEIFVKILSFTLIFAHCIGFTNFEHIALDGTILKAFNSPFNILKMDDIDNLIKHYTIEKLDDETIKDLRLSAQNFIFSENLTDNEKIETLYTLKEILTKSKQSSIGINDITAKWMYNKQHRKQISFNLQHGVDVKTNLICGINVTRNPTDHYEIPALMENIITNLNGIQPKIISADTIYRTIPNLTYLNNKNITALTPTRKQGKESINNLNKDPYSSDYFPYDREKDVVICPKKEILKPYGPYPCKPDKFGFIRQQKVYSNYSACQKCPAKEKCCKKSKHRTITRYNHELLDKAEELMEEKENKIEYKKRSRVESPNGPYKTYYHINELHIIGIEYMQCIIEEIAAAFNLKRLYNIIKEKEINFNDIYKIMTILLAPSSNFICNSGILKNEQCSTWR